MVDRILLRSRDLYVLCKGWRQIVIEWERWWNNVACVIVNCSYKSITGQRAKRKLNNFDLIHVCLIRDLIIHIDTICRIQVFKRISFDPGNAD